MRPVVRSLHRFPVKGFPAEPMERATARAGTGLDGDRAAAFTNGTAPADPGSWARYSNFTVLKNDFSLQGWSVATTRDGVVSLTAPDGRRVAFDPASEASSAAASWLPEDVLPAQGPHPRRLVTADQGMFDSRVSGLSIINPATVEVLGRATGEHLDPLRFRGNLLVEGLEPWEEFALVGRHVRLGGTVLWIRSSIERCPATRVDPATGSSRTNVPRLLAACFGHLQLGVYGVVLRTGEISVGDRLEVLDPEEAERLLAADGAGAPRPAPTRPEPKKPGTAPRLAEVLETETADDVVRVVLRDPFGWLPHRYRPGMHCRLHWITPEGPVWRNYTVTRADGDRCEIRVRRQGRGSALVHALEPGRRVLFSGPFGRLVDDALAASRGGRTAVLTVGIGITPALALSRSQELSPGSLRLLHVERGADGPGRPSREFVELRESARARGHRASRWNTADRGRPDRADLAEFLAGADDVVVCGPAAFAASARAAAAEVGIAAENVLSETFASPGGAEIPDLPEAGVRVKGAERDRALRWRPEEGFLLDLLEREGVPAPFSCRGGSCGTCTLELAAGVVRYPQEPVAEIPAGSVLTCCSVPDGDVVLRLE